MWYIIIIILIIIIAIFCINSSPDTKKKEKTLLDKLKENNIEIADSPDTTSYDYQLISTNKKIYLKIISIPEYAEVQINNKYTWEIKYGAGRAIGKAQPYKKLVKNIKGFVDLEVNDKQELKLVLFTPKPKKITKWINECEIIFVDFNTDVYSVHMSYLTNMQDIIKYLKEE